MIGQIISHYKIIEKLGEGGMGVVYKAHDTKLDRLVALKFLPHHITAGETEKARLLQEARAAATLNHPNVCIIHDIMEIEDQQFIVMEYVDGQSLRHVISNRQLTVDNCISYAIQIAEALEHAHGKSIVHRDIKADNMMVNALKQVKVMDFGLAKIKGSLKLTRTSSTVGTLAYMAPEQIQGGEVDARSDIFSFGVLLFEMLTGRTPFRGEHEAAMVYSIVNEEPEPVEKYVPDISPELVHILAKALEKDPADRYQNISDMAVDLRRLKKQTSKLSRQYPAPSAHVPFASSAQIPSAQTEVTSSSRPTNVSFLSKNKIWIGSGLGLLILIAIAVFFRGGSHELNPDMTFRVLQIPFSEISYPALSPDGNWAAYPARDVNGKWDIYYMNATSGEPRRVTADSSLYSDEADISPDGGQIAYVRFNTKTRGTEVCIVSSLGGLSRKVAENGFHGRWRPDGQRLGYMVTKATSQSKKFEVWSVKPDGSDNRLEVLDSVGISIPSARISYAWSPNGKEITWLRTFRGNYQEIVCLDLETKKERQLTSDKKAIDEVCWTSRDEIVFSSNRGGNSNLWIIPAAGGTPQQITKGGGPDLGMKIAADGKKLLYVQQQAVGHIWVAGLDGGATQQLTFDDRNCDWPTISPDGKQIAFGMSDTDPMKQSSHLYVVDRDGSNRRQLTSGDEVSSWPKWSPDGKWIAFRSWLPTETQSSSKIYLIDASSPGSPKQIGRGYLINWMNSSTIIGSTDTTNWLISLGGDEQKRIYVDSTLAYPILAEKYVLCYDLHKGRNGWWIFSGTDQSTYPDPHGKKLLPFPLPPTLPLNERFFYFSKSVGELSRISLPEGKEERVQGTFPGLTPTFNIRADGKELVYADHRISAKLVMIENLFK